VSKRKSSQTLKPAFVQADFDNLTIHDSIFSFSHFPDDDRVGENPKKKLGRVGGKKVVTTNNRFEKRFASLRST
jgi:hypothetical protein